jgi:hypothetical protein
MEVLFEKIRGSCWVDRGSQHGFFNGRGGGLIENEKKERKREREKERKRERVGFENNSTFHNFTRLENETKIFFAILNQHFLDLWSMLPRASAASQRGPPTVLQFISMAGQD